VIKLLKIGVVLYEQRTLRSYQKQLLRLYLRLHLQSLLDLQSSPTVLPLSLSHHVETNVIPIRKYIRTGSDKPTTQCVSITEQSNLFDLVRLIHFLVEMSGIEPESTMPSLRRNYNNTLRTSYSCRNWRRSKSVAK
jgi:hypothetical protein